MRAANRCRWVCCCCCSCCSCL